MEKQTSDNAFRHWKSAIEPHYLDLFVEPAMNLALSRILPAQPGQTLLDFGCGPGDKTFAFAQLGFEATGLDINPDYVAEARRRFPAVEFICQDGHELPFPEGSFDVFHSFSVLQYLDHATVFREAHRVLKPGGKAIFIENLRNNWVTKTYRALHRLAGLRYTDFQTPRGHIVWENLPDLLAPFGRFERRAFHLMTPLSLIPSEIKSRILQGSGCFYPPNALFFNVLKKADDFLLRGGRGAGGCWLALVVLEKAED